MLFTIKAGGKDNETQSIKLVNVVALTVDLSEEDLLRRQVGTVVESLIKGKAFEVEFSAPPLEGPCHRKGRTYQSSDLTAEVSPITGDASRLYERLESSESAKASMNFSLSKRR